MTQESFCTFYTIPTGARPCRPDSGGATLAYSAGFLTNLVSEPYLDKRTAALLSNLADRNHLVVDGLSLIQQLAAVYFEEDLLTETVSFHGLQTAGSKKVEKVVEAM
jgi:hypothetical protein